MNYQLYNEDCLEVMPNIESNSINLILTDLPYGITNRGKGKNTWDVVIPFDKLWNEYTRILKPNGVVVLTTSSIFTGVAITSNKEWYKYKWVWEKSMKTNFLNAKKQPLRKHEDVLVFYDKQPTYNPQGVVKVDRVSKNGGSKTTANYGDFVFEETWNQEFTNYPDDCLKFKTDTEKFHPTQKPVALFEYLIKTYTNEGDLVLDNCFGSNTTGVACANTNRNFIGIEQDEKYYDIGKRRIESMAI